MRKVGVVANTKKTMGGGLDELRASLLEAGIEEPLWHEVSSSRKAGKAIAACVAAGVELILVWGGDGTVQRSIDALVDGDRDGTIALGILPAGTANLLATNLGVPVDLRQAVDVALHGRRRRLDVGRLNGEYFAVMAGAGFDARMIRDADKQLKGRIGRAAYVWTGLKNLRSRVTEARITVDGKRWWKGPVSCVLVGNVGTLVGGMTAFPDARPDSGVLEVGVVMADSWWQWVRVLARSAVGHVEKSPLVKTTSGKRIDVKLDHKLPYQVDGGYRRSVRRLKVKALPHAVTICVPPSSEAEPKHG